VSGWGALYAPRGTNAEVVKRIGDVARKALASPDFQKVLTAAGLTPAASSPEDLIKLMKTDIALWKTLPDKGIRLSE
jgi:tripartite-type tricarboxylate transporter receptor subunit TctC